MSNINNLINKILDEAKLKSQDIIKSAKEEEEKIVQNKLQEANSLKAEMLEKAKLEASTKKSRILSNAELKVRNENLAAKQEVISKVLDTAMEELSSMSKEEYLSYIKGKILSLDINEDMNIILNSKGKEIVSNEFVEYVNKTLLEKDKKWKVVISEETRDFKGGFILEKNGIEINNTFEALINSMKDELEYDIANVLFS